MENREMREGGKARERERRVRGNEEQRLGLAAV